MKVALWLCIYVSFIVYVCVGVCGGCIGDRESVDECGWMWRLGGG